MQPDQKAPESALIVKGAWSSASDSVTPLPEDGKVVNGVFTDPYFGMTYVLPDGWTEKFKGPPPSDRGRYVLAQIAPADTYKGPTRGNILITAQDMFFSPLPATNALELVSHMRDNLQAEYEVESPPADREIGGHRFRFFAYVSPAAGLHWYVAATVIRCHTVEVVLTSRDTKLLDALLAGMNKMRLPEEASPTAAAGGRAFPVCIKDYARPENVLARVEPVFAERTFNAVPVRIVIGKQGTIKHVHFLSAFPSQTKAISDALGQWKFKPYLQNGEPVEVETGIVFGHVPVSDTAGRESPSHM